MPLRAMHSGDWPAPRCRTTVRLESARSWPASGLVGAQRRAEQTPAARSSRAPMGDSPAMPSPLLDQQLGRTELEGLPVLGIAAAAIGGAGGRKIAWAPALTISSPSSPGRWGRSLDSAFPEPGASRFGGFAVDKGSRPCAAKSSAILGIPRRLLASALAATLLAGVLALVQKRLAWDYCQDL